MTLKKHTKHAKLTRVLGGDFHRNEMALLGAPCSVVNAFAQDLARQFAPMRVGYIDAAHQNKEALEDYSLEVTDNISHFAHRFTSKHFDYEKRALFDAAELVLVNGNHFKAEKQVVFINEAKKESLHRKLDRLTDVLAFVLDEGCAEIHDFLKEDFSHVPVFSIHDRDKILKELKKHLRTVPLNGLVLAGGKSLRMGEDKGKIRYHKQPQREHAAALLAPFCQKSYLSVAEEVDSDLPQIKDRFLGLGPYGGILSAFQHNPNSAWLTVATDIPLLDEQTIAFLVSHRDSSKVASCFYNPETDFPEPLITIWEPRAYPRLLSFLAKGYSCPRKVLINSDIALLKLNDTSVLDNANTPEERAKMMAKITS